MKDIDRNSLWKLYTLILFGFLSASLTSINPCFAQSNIVPDNTLGAEPSRINNNVNVNNIPSTLIEGGAERGQNLFHSLQELNVSEGTGVYFIVPNDAIQNVLTRVTGNNFSQILGTLGISQRIGDDFVGKGANLFLINPNGIVFGENASLDINGSFVGTTANAIEFGGQGFFSATNPQAPPLLTVSPSAFLFSQINQTASIQNNSVADSGIDPAGFNVFGLRVPDGKSLLLLGGNVNMNRGELNAYGGRVELGGLAETGTVALDINGDNLSLGFPQNVTRADVSLTNQAKVYVEANGGGDIAVNARNIEITGGSGLFAGIGEGLGTPETVAGDITLNATGEIKVADSGSRIFNQVFQDSTGNTGNINIETNKLSLTDRAQLLTRTYGKGNAGSVTINASDTVFLKGFEGNTQPTIGSDVVGGSSGNGNDIKIEARSIVLDNGAIAAASILYGKGENGNPAQAGNVIFQAREQVVVDNNSRVYSEVGSKSVGNGGSINIKAPEVILNNGAYLITQIQENGKGNAGDINIIETGRLSVSGGSGLYATTSGQGDAGSIKINATDTVKIGANSGFFVSSTSSGNTGNIEIKSPKITLDNQGRLNAESTSGNGGNIDLNADKLLLLRRGSQITTNAGTQEQGGDGGNITINAPNSFIVAIPEENSDITANAFKGTGGNVEINSLGVFGIEPRPEQTDKSDITASSQLGVPGNINLITPDNSSIENSLTDLPQNPIDSEALIATSCVVRSKERNGTFYITGGEGFPYRPGDAVPSNYSAVEVQSIPNDTSLIKPRRWKIGDPIVEPSGVYRLANGRRILSRECSR